MYILISYGPPLIASDDLPDGVLFLDDVGPLMLDDDSYLILE